MRIVVLILMLAHAARSFAGGDALLEDIFRRQSQTDYRKGTYKCPRVDSPKNILPAGLAHSTILARFSTNEVYRGGLG